MKKQTIIIFIMIIVITIIVAFAVAQNVNAEKTLINYNAQYNKYLNQQVLGTEVASLINKIINTNEKNNIEKDEKEYYIPNTKNSIKMYIKLVPEEDAEAFPMERIYNVGITEFVKNFSLMDFTCTKVNYHKETGQVSELYFEVI